MKRERNDRLSEWTLTLCHSLTLASTTQTFTWRCGMGERRIKVRKVVGKNSLTGKVKAVHTSKANQGIHSPLLMGRQLFSQENRAPSHIVVTKAIIPDILLFFLLPAAVTDEQAGVGYPLGRWGQLCSLSNPCAPPASWKWGGKQRRIWLCVSPVKHPCVISTVFPTNPEYRLKPVEWIKSNIYWTKTYILPKSSLMQQSSVVITVAQVKIVYFLTKMTPSWLREELKKKNPGDVICTVRIRRN